MGLPEFEHGDGYNTNKSGPQPCAECGEPKLLRRWDATTRRLICCECFKKAFPNFRKGGE